MKDLLDKLSTYNIFNYLFPGVIFSIIVSSTTSFKLIQPNLITGAFVYYFLGLSISRIGSILLDPLFKKSGFIKWAQYDDFVIASKIDSKLELLSEINNMYRTITSMLLLVFLANLYDLLIEDFLFFKKYGGQLLILLLTVLFIFSFKKQSEFIVCRIKITKNDSN